MKEENLASGKIITEKAVRLASLKDLTTETIDKAKTEEVKEENLVLIKKKDLDAREINSGINLLEEELKTKIYQKLQKRILKSVLINI